MTLVCTSSDSCFNFSISETLSMPSDWDNSSISWWNSYLSKLENDHADYPPSKEVIQSLAKHLNLDEQELTQLAGRIDPEDAEIFRDLIKQYQEMPVLLRRMRDNPKFAKKVFSDINKDITKEE